MLTSWGCQSPRFDRSSSKTPLARADPWVVHTPEGPSPPARPSGWTAPHGSPPSTLKHIGNHKIQILKEMNMQTRTVNNRLEVHDRISVIGKCLLLFQVTWNCTLRSRNSAWNRWLQFCEWILLCVDLISSRNQEALLRENIGHPLFMVSNKQFQICEPRVNVNVNLSITCTT